MTHYPVESREMAMRSTGIVAEVMDWVEGPDGKRRPGKTQSRNEDTGMPLWDVEVLYRQSAFGRESNTTAMVRVEAPVQPVLAEFAPILFDRLTVDVRPPKAGTGLIETWTAEAIREDKSERPSVVKAAAS